MKSSSLCVIWNELDEELKLKKCSQCQKTFFNYKETYNKIGLNKSIQPVYFISLYLH